MSSSRSRSREGDIRRHPSNPRASLDSRVENVVIPSNVPSIATRSEVSASPARNGRSRVRSRDRSRGHSRSRSRGRSLSRSTRRSRRSRSRSSRRSHRSSSGAYYPRVRSRSRSPRRRRHRSNNSDRSSILRHLPIQEAVPAISRDNVRSLRSWMTDGLPPAEAKALREIFTPSFESSFTLQCPLLDESMGRTLKRLKGSSGSVVDFVEKTWLSTHYKILDIARPLIQLWGSLPPAHPHLQHVVSALRLWGVAFRDVTMNRRKNILRQTAPDFLNLLSDPTMFSNREMSRLFGVHFLNAMAKEADEENKIAKVRRSGGHSHSSRRLSNNYTRGGGAATQKSSAGPSSGGSRGTGGNSQRSSGSVNSVLSAFVSCPYPPVGGRLSQFAHEWRSISSDPFILNMVSIGVSLDFLSLPSQSTRPTNCKMSLEMERACDLEVSELIVKRAIFNIPESSGKFFSSLFLVPKKTGGYRPIINLKKLNSYIRFEHFKMEGMDSVRHLIRQGDWMVKLDLKDAYLSVPICLEHQPFLCFRWRGICYQFTCLAFGLSPAPRLFTKLLKPVVGALRRAGIRLVIYLDDIIFMNESREGVISDVSTAIDLLTGLGFLVNWEKSVLLPSQSLEYLGLLVDSVALSLALPSDKVLSMLEMCRRSLSKGVVSLHDLSSLIGNFSWAIPTIPFAQAHYRHLQRLYIYHSKSFNYDLSRYVALSSSARDDIRWWLENLSSSNGLCFLKRDPDLIIYSDASLHGWGFACDGVCSRGPWAGSDRLRHINELELLAAFYALKSLTAQSTNLEVNLILDNSTAVSYVNKHGGTRSRALCDISSSIVSWCESHNLSLTATHLPGILNSIADEQSRTSLDASDWMLCRSPARKLLVV